MKTDRKILDFKPIEWVEVRVQDMDGSDAVMIGFLSGNNFWVLRDPRVAQNVSPAKRWVRDLVLQKYGKKPDDEGSYMERMMRTSS